MSDPTAEAPTPDNAEASETDSRDEEHETIVPSTIEGGTVDDALAHVLQPFPDFATPAGYGLTASGVMQGDRQVASVPVTVARAYRDSDGTTTALQLRWVDVLTGQPRAAVLPIRDLRDRGRLLRHAGTLPVTSTNTARFVDYVEALVLANRETLPWELSVEQLGWTEVADAEGASSWRYVLPGARGVSLVGQLTQGEGGQIASAISQTGDLDGWVAALRRLKDHPRAQIPVSAALAAPLLRVLEVPGFVLDVYGISSRGKTTLLQAAASTVGAPGVAGRADPRLVCTWDATIAGLTDRLAVCAGFPSFVDERRLARSPDVPGDVAYQVADGRERTRSSVDGDREARTFTTVLLSTGEGPLEVGDRSGVPARTLLLRAPLFELPSLAESEQLARGLVHDLGRHYGHALPSFVNRLQRTDLQAVEAHFTQVAAWLRSQATSEVGGRRATAAAAVFVAHDLAHSWGLLPDRPGAEYLELVAGDAEADDPHRGSLETLVGAAVSDPRAEDRALRLADGRLAVEAGWAKEVLQRHGLRPREHLAAWRDRGWTDVEPGRHTRKARLPRGPVQCVVVNIDALELVGSGNVDWEHPGGSAGPL